MKRILKKCLSLVVFIVLFFSLSMNTYALEENIDSYKEEFDFQSMADAIDDETAGILAEIGIDEISFENVEE